MIGRRTARQTRRGLVDGVASGAEPWTPLRISGAVWWVRADRGIQLNGTTVKAWNDQSGVGDNNRNLVQATAAKQPTWNAVDAGANNYPTLSLASASSQYLGSIGTWSISYPQPYTMFIVGQSDYAAQEVWTSGNSSGLELFCTTTSLFGSAGTNVFAASTALKNTMGILGGTFVAGTGTIYANHYSTALATGPCGANTLGSIFVGSRAGGQFFLNGKIAEAVVYERALNAQELKTLVTYFGNRYAISVSA